MPFSLGGIKRAGLFVAVALLSATSFAQASVYCPGTQTSTWTAGAGSTTWTTITNWSPSTSGYPGETTPLNDSGANVNIQSESKAPTYPASSLTVGCFQISSGSFTYPNSAVTLTVQGDFVNENEGSLSGTGTSWIVSMAGTSAQVFDDADTVPNLTINNPSSVDFINSTTVSTAFTITQGTVYVDGYVTVPAFTIPSGSAVEIRNGGTLNVTGNITVNGTLRVDGGALLQMNNSGTSPIVTVNSGGTLLLAGESGNVASISAPGLQSFGISIASGGSINASYFYISRCRNATAGLSISGTILNLSNGEFHYPSGEAITLQSGAVNVATWANVGFFDDSASGAQAVVATNYDSGVTCPGSGTINVTPWSGIDTTTDSKGCIVFGTQSPLAIEVQNASNGPPTSPISAGGSSENFGAFGFSLNGTGTATTITSVTLTLEGNNAATDVTGVTLYWNTNGECWGGTTNGPSWSGTFSGSPPTAVIPITGGTVSLSNTSIYCMQAYMAASANAINGDTIGLQIAATADVTDSQGYGFSTTSGPPISLGVVTITGGVALNNWTGGTSTAWNTATNWSSGAVPTATTACEVGSGNNIPTFTAAYKTPVCLNAHFESGGQINFASQAATLTIDGNLIVDSGFTLSNAGSSTLALAGTSAQSVNFNGGTWPGNVTLTNTNGATLGGDMTISGNLTINSGTLTVGAGETLTVGGNLTIGGSTTTAGLTLGTGATLIVGGTTLTVGGGSGASALNLGAGSELEFTSAANPVLTVSTNGTLAVVGTSNQPVMVTSDSTSHAYTVNVTGNPSTISAQYYTRSNLGTTGVTIGANATINSTNYLQNGNFYYPVNNNSTLLTLNVKIPGNALTGMTFDSDGSSATGTKSIVATSSVPTPTATLTINNYTGSYTGSAFSTNGTHYTISWGTATNTLKLTNPSGLTTPSSLSRGSTVTMGDWAFQESSSATGATNLTSIMVTMTGTDGAGDISSAALYQDTACNGTVGAQLGTSGTLSGSPATITFSGFTDSVSTTQTCVLLQFTVSSSAAAGTIGAEIAANGDVTNSAGYAFAGYAAPSVTLGSPGTVTGSVTTWTGGALTSAWTTSSNWSAGVPNSTTDCVIASTSHNPTITGSTTAVCKNVTINSGATLTLTSGSLQVHGNFTNNGTFTAASGQALQFADGGAALTQTVSGSGTNTWDTLTFSKSAGGTVALSSATVTVNTAITFSGTSTLDVQSGTTLILPSGVTVAAAKLQLEQNSILEIGSGKTLTVSGGSFIINGASTTYPNQVLSGSGEVTVQGGSGTWSFNATSGTVSLTGWVFDHLATTGAVIGGTTTLSALQYGQFTHLSTGTIKTVVINTTGTIPTTAPYIGWEWDSSIPGLNSDYPQSASPPAVPSPAGSGYLLASSTGCGNQTMSFNNWFGDWAQSISAPNPQSQVSATGCTLTFSAGQSPVSLLSFTATPYDSTAVLNWATGLEVANQGFNVYRSLSPNDGYVQINSGLIRNLLDQGTIHGVYQFYDRGLVDGLTYYYEIEDIASNGTATLHGPVSATPQSALGAAPAPTVSSIQGTNSDNPLPSPSPTQAFAPGITQLASGVTLVAQTDHTMRITISVPAFTTQAAQVSPYVNVFIPGYSSTTAAGLPALPERVVMIEIPGATSAADSIVSATSVSQSGILVAPALTLLPSNGVLTPTWAVNQAFYNTDQSLPASPISLGSIVQNQGHTYLPLIIEPLAFDPVQSSVNFTSLLTVDITLNGDTAWTPANPSPPSGPWGLEDALKISVTQEGVYQLAYSDFVNAGVSGAFAGRDLTHFKLYSQSTEIPLDVTSVNGGAFGTGDSIRFFAPYFATGESNFNDLMLIVDNPASAPGLRMQALPGSPTGAAPNLAAGYINTVHVEQNFFEWLNSPYMTGASHIFWAQYEASPSDHSLDSLTASFNLPALVQSGTVTVTATVAGGYGSYTSIPLHHLRIWVNSDPNPAGDAYFTGTSGYNALFDVPANLFVPGTNQIRFQSVGDLNGADYDVQGMDYFTVDYTHEWSADADVADFSTSNPGKAIDVAGFSGSDILIYDVSDYTASATVSGAVVNGTSGAAPYDVSFAGVAGNSSQGRHFWIGRASNLPTPASIQLNPGSSLASTSNGADVIYIGTADLLDSIRPLAQLRQQEGFRTQVVDIEDVYSEFGEGLRSAADLKAFLQFASARWAPPAPRYVVLVGGGTDDPTNSLGMGTADTLPAYMMLGSAMDFASDNWLVAFDSGDDLPAMAIGRIPGRTPAAISSYVAKVLAYENGNARPAPTATGNLTLVADIDQDGGELFAPTAQALATQVSTLNPSIKPTLHLRPQMTDSALQASIVQSFGQATVIHYLGHGAENEWANSTVFTNDNATQLQNTTYPVVVAMDCLNGAFFYANPSFVNLSEALLFNPNGGAIAFWGATSLTSVSQQIPYENALYEILAKHPGGIRLGDAVMEAKIQAGWVPERAEMVRSFTLFGDPMVNVILPAPPAQSQDDNSSGGFFSCLSIAARDGGPKGPGSGPSPGNTAEAGLLFLLFYASRRMNVNRNRAKAQFRI